MSKDSKGKIFCRLIFKFFFFSVFKMKKKIILYIVIDCKKILQKYPIKKKIYVKKNAGFQNRTNIAASTYR